MTESAPAWAQTLINQNKALNDRLNAIESGSPIKQQLSAKLKDYPASLWAKRPMPERPEDIEAFVSEVQQDYQKDFVDKGLAQPLKTSGNEKPTKEEIDKVVGRLR